MPCKGAFDQPHICSFHFKGFLDGFQLKSCWISVSFHLGFLPLKNTTVQPGLGVLRGKSFKAVFFWDSVGVRDSLGFMLASFW